MVVNANRQTLRWPNGYWTCQVAGWTIYGLITAAIPTLYAGLRWVVVGRALVGVVSGIVLTDQLRRHMRRHAWLQLPLHRLLPRIAVASVVTGAGMMACALPFLLAIIPPGRAGPFSAIFAGHFTVVLVWCVIYAGFHYFRSVRTAEEDKLRLELAMRETELLALRSQLNPHFLFNSLNSMRGLVTEDPGRARDAITRLASLLRYTLRLSRSTTTTLARELEATRHYLELEAVRFEARLRYQIDVDPNALEHHVPPLLVQTLVENGIKHGIAQKPAGGVVRIEAHKRNGDLVIRVTNTGELNGTGGAGGIGLRNSIEQLRLLFGDRARFDLRASAPDEVTCEIMVAEPAAVLIDETGVDGDEYESADHR